MTDLRLSLAGAGADGPRVPPLGAWLPGLFPARVRYTGASVAFNVGGILGGALAPLIAQALADWGGLMPVGLYLSGAALVSLIALTLARG